MSHGNPRKSPRNSLQKLRSRARRPGVGGLGLLAIACLLVGGAGGAAASPIVKTRTTPLAGGLTRYDVDVDFRDGLSRSGFVQVTLAGPFDAQSQLLEENWPDIQEVQSSAGVFMLQGGTGGGSHVDVVGLGQMVVPSGQAFTYNAVISRNGQNFIVAPEPDAALLAGSALALLGLLAKGAANRRAVRGARRGARS